MHALFILEKARPYHSDTFFCPYIIADVKASLMEV